MNIRLPFTLKELVKRFVSMDTHMNESEFVRDAIREKLQREAPKLLLDLFVEED